MNNSIFTEKIQYMLEKYIDSDYILVGLPKHMNLGDTLIWEAEESYLCNINYKCLSMYFWGDTNIDINSEVTIIFSGGGTWDDIWNSIDYIEFMLAKFNNNKFIFLPNDVWYNNINRATLTSSIINNRAGNIVLFNRNILSFNLANKLFPDITNELLPDVVLGWDINTYMQKNNIAKENGNGTLHITRKDIESINYVLNDNIDFESDWPTINNPIFNNVSCKEWHDNIKPLLIKIAILFIIKYKTIYSSRMHGGILALLLDKNVIFIDNSYHKTKSLYDTWLSNINNVQLYKNSDINY